MTDDPLYEPLRDAIRWQIFLAGATDGMVPAAIARATYERCKSGEMKNCKPFLDAHWNATAAAIAAVQFIRHLPNAPDHD